MSLSRSCVGLDPGASSSCLPEDLIMEIGTRLPVESIGRCRCVQKHWNSALSNPVFIETLLSQATGEKVLVRSVPKPSVVYSLQFEIKNCTGHGINLNCSCDRVLGSCKSLILIEKCESLFVMNLTTKISKELAPRLSEFWGESKHSVCGLCFDNVALDHCIVEVSWYGPERPWIFWYPRTQKGRCFISHYLLKENRWNLATPTLYDFDVPRQKCGVLYDRALHWIVWDDKDDSYVITAYDVSKKEFKILPAPALVNVFEEDEGHELFPELEIIQGCLGLITGGFWTCVELWVMRKYGERESWMKLPILLDCMVADFVPYGCSENWLIIEDMGNFKLLVLDGKEVTTHDVDVSGLPVKYKYVGTWTEGLAGIN